MPLQARQRGCILTRKVSDLHMRPRRKDHKINTLPKYNVPNPAAAPLPTPFQNPRPPKPMPYFSRSATDTLPAVAARRAGAGFEERTDVLLSGARGKWSPSGDTGRGKVCPCLLKPERARRACLCGTQGG